MPSATSSVAMWLPRQHPYYFINDCWSPSTISNQPVTIFLHRQPAFHHRMSTALQHWLVFCRHVTAIDHHLLHLSPVYQPLLSPIFAKHRTFPFHFSCRFWFRGPFSHLRLLSYTYCQSMLKLHILQSFKVTSRRFLVDPTSCHSKLKFLLCYTLSLRGLLEIYYTNLV